MDKTLPKSFKDRQIRPRSRSQKRVILSKILYNKQNAVIFPSKISLKLIQYSVNLDIVPNSHKMEYSV